MKNAMRMGILAVAIVLFASVAMLASPASADSKDDVVYTAMSAEDFLALAGDGKIVLDEDVKLTSALKIASEIELDLAGHELVNGGAFDTITVENGGKLTVTDSKTGGIVDNVNNGKAALHIDNGGEATLYGGTFERSKETAYNINGKAVSNPNSWYTIWNDGTLTIKSGVTVKNYVLKDGDTLGNASSLIINGKSASAQLTIDGGTFIGGLYIKNEVYGTLTINDGTFKGIASWTLFNYNETTITGGSFTGNKSIIANGDENKNPIKLTITGGDFTWAEGTEDRGLVDIYPSTQKDSTFDVTVSGIAAGKKVFTTENGETIKGSFTVNGQKIEMEDIKTGADFAIATGPSATVDLGGAYADGSVVVNGDVRLTGSIDSSATFKVASGSVTVPEGKTLSGTILMGESNKVDLDVTAGTGGLVVTPTAIGGSTSGTGSIDITGKVSVKDSLTLDEVEVSVSANSELSVPKEATISGGKVENSGTVVIDGAVKSPIANSGKVSAAIDAEVSDVEGGEFDQVKPVIERKVFDANVPVGGLVTFAVTVTDGASVKLTGADWASYDDGLISGKPKAAGQYIITATPYIGENYGDAITFTVNVYNVPIIVPDDSDEPVIVPEKEKKEESPNTLVIAVALIVIALILIVIIRFI